METTISRTSSIRSGNSSSAGADTDAHRGSASNIASMPREHSLNAYLHFEAVARRGTLARAAEELLVSPSAVSQQLKLLEQQLGIKLFRREGRRLALTAEGEQLYEACSAPVRILRDVRRHLGKARSTWRLDIRVTPSFGVRWLGPRLSRFIAANPGWDLRVDAAPDPTDFDSEIMDLDIRYGLGGWAGHFSEAVMSDHVLPLCSPAYRDSLCVHADDLHGLLARARFIDSARALCRWDWWLPRHGITCVANARSIVMDRSSMALDLARDGMGVVLESLALASGELCDGSLVPLSIEAPVISFPAYWIVCPRRHLSRRVVGTFADWLASEIETHESRVRASLKHHALTVETIDAPAELIPGDLSRASAPGRS